MRAFLSLSLATHLNRYERESIVGPFKNHAVVHRRIPVCRAGLNLRKSTDGPKVLDLLHSSIFRIGMD